MSAIQVRSDLFEQICWWQIAAQQIKTDDVFAQLLAFSPNNRASTVVTTSAANSVWQSWLSAIGACVCTLIFFCMVSAARIFACVRVAITWYSHVTIPLLILILKMGNMCHALPFPEVVLIFHAQGICPGILQALAPRAKELRGPSCRACRLRF